MAPPLEVAVLLSNVVSKMVTVTVPELALGIEARMAPPMSAVLLLNLVLEMVIATVPEWWQRTLRHPLVRRSHTNCHRRFTINAARCRYHRRYALALNLSRARAAHPNPARIRRK